MLNLTFHTDPGHGWLEVDLALVRRLAVHVSQFSYVKGNKAYLEEDCDAPRFTDLLDSEGIEYKITEKYTENTPIRNYHRWNEYFI
jgi:hypothetical protein